MTGKTSKSLITLLDILRSETDKNHTLTQKELRSMLEKRLREESEDETVSVGRKTLHRYLITLLETGFVSCDDETSIRGQDEDGDGEAMLTDFYYNHEFDENELRLLIDSLMFSKHIPVNQCKRLVKKLERQASSYFRSRVRHISTFPDTAPQNKQLFYTIEILDEAITENKKVAFQYISYGTDKKPKPRTDADGKAREYVVNPYQIAAANGRYYLVCNYDKANTIANYRLDRIINIRKLDESRKPTEQVRGMENGLDLPRHMAEHIYMYTGESAAVTFRMSKRILNDIFDWFGNEAVFFDETEDEVSARVTVNLQAMRRWAVQYSVYARVLSPQSLVDAVKEDLETARKNYGMK